MTILRGKQSFATLLLAFAIVSVACSKAVPRPHLTGKGGGGAGSENAENGGGGGGGEPGTVSGEEIKGFAPNLLRIDSLSFRSLLNKLSTIAGVDPKAAEQAPAFKLLVSNRYNLGDYNYATGNLGSKLWETSQMNLWLESLLPYCQSKDLKTKYKTDVEAFVQGSLGRALSADEKTIFNQTSALASNKDLKFEAACLSFLTSLEFRTQWAPATPGFEDYISILSSSLLQEPLAAADKATKADTLEAKLQAWTASPRFLLSARQFMDHLVRASGESKDINYNIPSQLLMGLIKNKQPYSQILQSSVCYDDNGAAAPCDSDAPFKAGVLTTRAFLSKHAGPFNLSRANSMVGTFACRSYPMGPIEPPLEKADLIPTFQQTSGQGFGNGTNCFGCHNQFGKHAQLFVKFDSSGHYIKNADGQQDPAPNASSGLSLNATAVSHLLDKGKAASEASQFFGKPVKDLSEAAAVLAGSSEFMDCTIRKVMGYYLRLEDTTRDNVDASLVTDIRNRILESSKDPTFSTIVTKTLSHPSVIKSFTKKSD